MNFKEIHCIDDIEFIDTKSELADHYNFNILGDWVWPDIFLFFVQDLSQLL